MTDVLLRTYDCGKACSSLCMIEEEVSNSIGFDKSCLEQWHKVVIHKYMLIPNKSAIFPENYTKDGR